MIRVIAYDIASPRRLRRISRICLDHGFRVEKSVFECDLPEERFRRFWRRLNAVIDDEEDSLLAYPVCRRCDGEVEVGGLVKRPEPVAVYVF